MHRRRLVWTTAGLLGLLLAVYTADTTGPAPTSPAGDSAAPRAVAPLRAPLRVVDALPAANPAGPQAWLADELLLRVRPGEDPARVAADHGATLRRAPGRSGLAPVRVPAGQDRDALLAALDADPRVLSASRAGRIQGAGGRGASGSAAAGGSAVTAVDYEWHLDAADVDTSGTYAAWVVAVLDTGVAYETYHDGSTTYAQATSLAGSSFVAPYDFVNDDAHPNDDNQHGTHIASVIASCGDVVGVAPGATLMPVKVLNADSEGSEADLVEALYHAVDNGADVINMSLTFSAGYAPSVEMREALEYAADSGVILVAAGGNDASQLPLFPASSPLVIGVGASSLKSKSGKLDTTWYSNLSPALDLVAPGGDLTQDKNKDGYPDGILAETFDPADPTDLGYWFYAGTSQSAAIVSGAVVQLLDAGLGDAEEVRVALQQGADNNYGSRSFLDGGSAGDLQVDGAVAVAQSALSSGVPLADDTAFVTVLPYLTDAKGDQVRPSVRLLAVDGNGDPLGTGLRVVGTLWTAEGEETFWCKPDAQGVCTARFDKEDVYDDDGDAAPMAWGITVDAVVDTGTNTSRPAFSGLFVTPELVWWVEAMDAAGVLEDHLLAVWWQAEKDATLGWLAESFAVSDLSTGRASPPTALLFNEAVIEAVASWDSVAVDLDAAGLATDPLGIGPILLPRLTLDLSSFSGGGLATDPLGFTSLKLLTFYGSGLATDPLGFRPPSLFDLSMRGSGLATDPLGIGTPFLQLSTGTLSSGSLSGTAMGTLIGSGGWLAGAEYPAASLLLSTGALDVGGESITLSTGGVGGSEL